jgi:RNA polymerase sigma-70 factor (ECF subfamily)
MLVDATFESVLAAAQGGDERAMAKLFRALHPFLLRYLRAKEPSFAEDLASEVWMGVWSGLPSFRGDERDFRAWLFTIASRRVADQRRRAGRQRAEPAYGPVLDDAPAPVDVAAQVAEGVSAQEAIQRLIATLPPDQAEVVLLRVLGDLEVSEVARLMGKSQGAVRVLQHRALRRMAERLAGTVDTEER